MHKGRTHTAYLVVKVDMADVVSALVTCHLRPVPTPGAVTHRILLESTRVHDAVYVPYVTTSGDDESKVWAPKLVPVMDTVVPPLVPNTFGDCKVTAAVTRKTSKFVTEINANGSQPCGGGGGGVCAQI